MYHRLVKINSLIVFSFFFSDIIINQIFFLSSFILVQGITFQQTFFTPEILFFFLPYLLDGIYSECLYIYCENKRIQ